MNHDFDEMIPDDEVYTITPKGIASLALAQCGLITNSNDPRVDGFWTIFEASMRMCGYIVEEDET